MLTRRHLLIGSASLAACKKNEPPVTAPMPKPDPEREKKVLARLEPWRKKHERPAWRYELRSGEGELLGSRIGGAPWLAKDEAWPRCRSCRYPMQFFLQLSTASLPKELAGRYGDGLVQLFYCANEKSYEPIEGMPPPPPGCQARDYEAFSPAHLVRLVTSDAPGRRAEAPVQLTPFRERPITGWSKLADGPHPEEFEGLGLKFDFDFAARTVRIACPELGLDEAGLPLGFVDRITECYAKDKLAGWPNWIQGAEYPHCPKCKRQMELVFQVDSEDGVSHMFGDLGTGHITQCPEHKDVLAFAWACS